MSAPRTALLREALRTITEDGPDAINPVPCPLCQEGDLTWQQIIQWRFYPDGKGFQIECDTCPLAEEIVL